MRCDDVDRIAFGRVPLESLTAVATVTIETLTTDIFVTVNPNDLVLERWSCAASVTLRGCLFTQRYRIRRTPQT